MNLRYRSDPHSATTSTTGSSSSTASIVDTHNNNDENSIEKKELQGSQVGVTNNKKYKKNVFPHTINGSGLAVGR